MTRILTLLLALTLAAPAVAQDTATKPAETTDATKPDSGLAMGTPADSDVGQPYTKETSGDWELQCVKAEEGEDPCQLYQLVMDEDGNPVAEFSLFRLPPGGQAVAGATIVVPLETALIEDLLLGVDGSKGKRYRFSFCSTIGCFARIGLTESDIASLKRGKTASLTIVPFAAPDVKVKLNMSLIGFTDGYDKTTVAPGQ
ncbi:invasion associated locus B family protein [Pseudooceanicola sp.]|uniref:invasion associated locus B family protein n=1 Tax=Pseudooceanicola sp. TaxID=1914328 RepID=UPI00260EE487|nr:invasion associated locus B family protein [Pseudooceanicola sp.]MDF1855791.1 invasion associated locus B family protein [Pseudooceanicola sp.]